MDTATEITKRTNQYAKHLLQRQREQSMSPENQLNTLRRRISIMNSLRKNYPTSPSNVFYTSNPFSKEFSNRIVKEFDKSRSKVANISQEEESSSIVDYFRDNCDYKEPIQPNFASESFEEEFQRNDWKIKHEGPDAFFAASIPEPDVIKLEHQSSNRVLAARMSDMNFHKKSLTEYQSSNRVSSARMSDMNFHKKSLKEYQSSSRVSSARMSDMNFHKKTLKEYQSSNRVSSARMSDMNFHKKTLDEYQTPLNLEDSITTYPQLAAEPKRLYPDLLSMKRTSGIVSPKTSQENVGERNEKTSDVVTETQEKFYVKPVGPETKTFSTSMPNPDSQMNNLVHANQNGQNNELNATSFPKRNRSWFNNLHLPNMMSKIELARKNEEAMMSDEVENHLELPLENTMPDQYSVSITYANPDAKASSINVSELISEDRSPTRQRTEQSKHSSTLNRTFTMYKTFTQRMKHKFRGSVVKNVPKPPQNISLPTGMNRELEEKVKNLLEKVKIEQTRISQASKALELCNTMSEFASSTEHIESERILVIAQLHHKAYLDEIRRLTSQHGDDSSLYCEHGQVSIGGISVQLRDEVQRGDHQCANFVEWFILVISEGTTIWATDAVPCSIVQQKIKFPGQLSISDLPPDFVISIKIYSMKVQRVDIAHEEKYHISKSKTGKMQMIKMACTSPKKLFKRSERKTSPKQFEVSFSGTKESSFTLCGSVELSLRDMNLKSPWPLTGVPANSVLHGTIDLELSCKLQLSVTHAGFLTHSDGIGGPTSWNRRWCVLEDRSLHFWNYPREQEYKPPLYSIDLECCVSKSIDPVDRSFCPRARTILVETMRKRKDMDRRLSCTVVRHLLSCDSNLELTEWQSKLNHVVSALRQWNIIDS